MESRPPPPSPCQYRMDAPYVMRLGVASREYTEN